MSPSRRERKHASRNHSRVPLVLVSTPVLIGKSAGFPSLCFARCTLVGILSRSPTESRYAKGPQSTEEDRGPQREYTRVATRRGLARWDYARADSIGQAIFQRQFCRLAALQHKARRGPGRESAPRLGGSKTPPLPCSAAYRPGSGPEMAAPSPRSLRTNTSPSFG